MSKQYVTGLRSDINSHFIFRVTGEIINGDWGNQRIFYIGVNFFLFSGPRTT